MAVASLFFFFLLSLQFLGGQRMKLRPSLHKWHPFFLALAPLSFRHVHRYSLTSRLWIYRIVFVGFEFVLVRTKTGVAKVVLLPAS